MEFRILGPLEVFHDGVPVPVTGSGQRALLALLLLHANEVVSTDRLLDALWPDEPPPSGSAALQVRVSHLRKTLGAGASLIVTRPPGYVIELGRGELDLYRFEELVQEAAGAEPEAAAATLRAALDLWRGPPLADLAYEAFAQPAIARLEELRLAALERRVEADLALGRHDELVGELEALVVGHPLRERLRGQLMLALYRAGRQAEALASFQAARKILVDALGIEPGPALRQLELAILRQDSSLDLAGTEVPDRSLLAVALEDCALDGLLALAEPLATRPARELILALLVSTPDGLPAANDAARQRQKGLRARGVVARSACFSSTRPGDDVVRLAAEQDVDLLLMPAGDRRLDDPVLGAVLAAAPCDVALVIEKGEELRAGPVVVPFAGSEHDWAAVELGAWVAGALGAELRLVGPRETERDASRLLASASLAAQRAFGVTAEPRLVEPGAEPLVSAADDAALVVVGLTDRWRREGLGPVRRALVDRARPPVVLARSGLRPGGLAPGESLTRFTWSVRPG